MIVELLVAAGVVLAREVTERCRADWQGRTEWVEVTDFGTVAERFVLDRDREELGLPPLPSPPAEARALEPRRPLPPPTGLPGPGQRCSH